ncbi:TIGR04255 family protein [Bathymodiolus japonicus methanotrophic gill symbiont]|uniref:TIGR04255 family protein n=1 Tax=Bathymodiolus japonicus methanotrophic gill symbiont TaxID=113269 RepID=UPI0021E12269|nr:TIGR04255 family protein [Bathymodiolus japonicus methanotrophic gill symbiont]
MTAEVIPAPSSSLGIKLFSCTLFFKANSLTNSTTTNYLRPPITEAVIEVRVNHTLKEENVNKIVKKLQSIYPNKSTVNNLSINITPQPEGGDQLNVNSRPEAYHLVSDDQINIAIVSSNSLAVSQLAPYQGWEAIHKNFVEAWKIWKRVSSSHPISRIGVRYINRIDIPLQDEKKIDLEEYLTFNPQVPILSDLPMVAYLMQITQPIDSLWSVNITSKGIQSPLVNNLSLLLDVDVFRTKDILLSDEGLWEAINEARSIKNDIFDKCITQKTKELFY